MTGRPLPCEEVRGLLDERLDRPLAADEEEALSAHLSSCAACRGAGAALRSVDAALLGMNAPDPGPGFSDRVIAALDRAPGAGPARREPPVPGGTRLLRGLVATAGTLAFAALAFALLPIDAAASTVGSYVPAFSAPPLPEIPAGLAGLLPAWASASLALLATAGAAIPVASLRRGSHRP